MGFLSYASFARPNKVEEKEFYKGDIPCVIDGVDVLDALCPVSAKTGLRENILSLIRKLSGDPAKQALLMQCLQELPVDNSQVNLDDQAKFEFCAQRLQVGTPAENALLVNQMEHVLDLYEDQLSAQQKQVEPSKINFAPADVSAPSSES